jgi:hypothetical protein
MQLYTGRNINGNANASNVCYEFRVEKIALNLSVMSSPVSHEFNRLSHDLRARSGHLSVSIN